MQATEAVGSSVAVVVSNREIKGRSDAGILFCAMMDGMGLMHADNIKEAREEMYYISSRSKHPLPVTLLNLSPKLLRCWQSRECAPLPGRRRET